MFAPVTQDTPELFADTRNKWQSIGKEYWQTDEKDGIVLEIRHHENGMFRWWLYDAASPEPDLAVILDDATTLAAALTAVYDYFDGYQRDTN